MDIQQNAPRPGLVEDLFDAVSSNLHSSLLLLLSGGSLMNSYRRLFRKLAEADIDARNLTISLVDERFGESDPMHTNYFHLSMLHELPMLEKQGAKLVPILKDNLDLAATTETFEKFLQLWAEGENKKIFGVFGLGVDFHTAGILPHKAEYTQMFYEKLAVGYKVDDISESDNQFRQRVTLSFKGMQLVDQTWVYAEGVEKEPVVAEFKSEIGKPHSLEETAVKPGLYLTERPCLKVFTY